ncbi:single-stranded DNA-binding protein [Streptomyces sp. NPDC006798]|uniref:single-stranded DNA-binding protein n=1 Tax=Streptomyces sp. NPDC006798 TaxID=3155462 RepID=UPI0033EF90A8
MYETTVTLVGNAATAVEYRETGAGPVARFRMAVTPRRRDRQTAGWSDGPTSFYTVFAWRGLAANLSGSLSVGDPVLVHGRLRVREVDLTGPAGENRERDGHGGRGGDGGRRTFVDVDALAVGHDLNRGTSAFRRVARPAGAAVPPEAGGAGSAAEAGGGAGGDPSG